MTVLLALILLTSYDVGVELDQAEARAAMVVLGDAVRGEPTTASTVVVEGDDEPARPVPLCHAENANAVAVATVIRARFTPGWWAWACRVSWCESRFNPRARNRSGATGLFQIMPMWFAKVRGADPWTFDGSARLARYVLDVSGPRAWSCK